MQPGLLETIYRNYETAHIPCPGEGRLLRGIPPTQPIGHQHFTKFDTRSFSPLATEQRDICAQKMHFPSQSAGIVQRI